ncbi:MAG: type VII toxin-antitoxin system HepT family RNase toxin [Polaromonas sp.]
MDRVVVDQKLESLRRCVARVMAKRPNSVAELVADVDAQDVIVLNLSRAVQICVDVAMHYLASADSAVPQTMGQAFELLAIEGVIDTALAERLRRAVGFRNLAVHSYDTIDWALVFAISGDQLDDFRAFAKSFA